MDRVHPNHDKSRREPTITRRSRFIMQRLACNTCAGRGAVFDEQRARILPASSLSNVVFGEGWHAHSFLLVRRCLVRPITGPPLTVSPFKEPIGTPVVFQSPPPSSIFSSDHRRIIVINILSKNWQHSAVPVCRHSGQSVNLQKAIDFDLCVCIQQLELSSTWNPIQIIAHVNYTYFALYQTRRCHRTQHICPPGKEIGFSVNKNLLFPCYTVFVFPSFLVLRVLFVSRIPILVTFEQEAKTLPTPESLAPSQLKAKQIHVGFGGSYCGW